MIYGLRRNNPGADLLELYVDTEDREAEIARIDAWCEAARRAQDIQTRVSARLTQLGVSEYEFALLHALRRSGGMLRVSELARAATATKGGLTRVATRLTDAGLAERVEDPSDGRAALVRLTEAGRELARRADQVVAAALGPPAARRPLRPAPRPGVAAALG